MENTFRKKKNIMLMIVIGLFIFNLFKFLNTEGSNMPIVSILFNLIFFLALIILLLHQDDFGKEVQTKLDRYFKTSK